MGREARVGAPSEGPGLSVTQTGCVTDSEPARETVGEDKGNTGVESEVSNLTTGCGSCQLMKPCEGHPSSHSSLAELKCKSRENGKSRVPTGDQPGEPPQREGPGRQVQRPHDTEQETCMLGGAAMEALEGRELWGAELGSLGNIRV